MNIFGILSMIGGLALFLYGMDAMGAGLSKLSGGRMERLLEKLTSKRIMAVLLLFITILAVSYFVYTAKQISSENTISGVTYEVATTV